MWAFEVTKCHHLIPSFASLLSAASVDDVFEPSYCWSCTCITSFTGLTTIVDLSFWNQIVLTFLFHLVDHNVVVYLYFESDAFDAYCLSNTPSVGLFVVSCSIIITSSATSSRSSTAFIAASLSSMTLNHVNIIHLYFDVQLTAHSSQSLSLAFPVSHLLDYLL